MAELQFAVVAVDDITHDGKPESGAGLGLIGTETAFCELVETSIR